MMSDRRGDWGERETMWDRRGKACVSLMYEFPQTLLKGCIVLVLMLPRLFINARSTGPQTCTLGQKTVSDPASVIFIII